MADTTIDLLKNSSYVGKMDELIAAVKSGGGTASDVEWDNVKNKPTTIGGYGIIDAKIDNGTITLGNQTITPLTSAPVTSVNSKTGAVTLSADDVSAIPSTLTGTAGQVLTKTADGQEWKDVNIPTALPNPNALTFTGAVTGSYDGSEALTVNIPAGGGGTGGGSSGTWELIGEVTSDGAGTNAGISIPCDISGYKSVFVYAQNLPGETNFRIVMRTTLTWSQAACFFGYNSLGKQGSFSFGAQSGKMNNLWSITGMAYNVANHIFSYGAAESQYNGGTAPWRQSEQSNKLPAENWANVKYISLDRNSSTDIVPEGCILRAWGCK